MKEAGKWGDKADCSCKWLGEFDSHSRPLFIHYKKNKTMKTGIELITQEREEQVTKHGRTMVGDEKANNHFQLSEAAGLLTYLNEEDVKPNGDEPDFSHCCPVEWDETIWNKLMSKPYKERLIIAGALLAAEIDRIEFVFPPL